MLIRLENIYKTYFRKNEFNAVDNINMNIDEGDFVSIIGKSGSGKSTLLNLISGILTPTSGKIFIMEKEITLLDDLKRSALRNDVIGFIPQTPVMLSALTVLDNICLPFYLYKRDGEPQSEANRLLKDFGIEYLKDSYPRELSGGELKRVATIRALINKPKVLLADEPTSNLDMHNTKEMLKIFKEINTLYNMAIILVTHEFDSLEYSKKVYTMMDGKLTEGKQFAL
ncbi:MAG: ABC transporter ATP-binding protein [Treponema sp.]